ncbi:uncharacterized protein LOC144664772 isoform X5 [Oculina patagonica]
MARWLFLFTVGFLLFCIHGSANARSAGHHVTKTAIARDIPPGEDGFIVTLEIFSGVPNPKWTIQQNHQNFSEIKSLFSSAQKYKPEDSPSKLGYEGFVVEEVKKGKKQAAVLIVGSETETLQLMLLWTAPSNRISTGIVEMEIRSGNVSANVTNSAKRYAAPYNPGPWNKIPQVFFNNCYNYASMVQNNAFAQPGTGSGNPFPRDYTAEDVKRAATSDGCVFTPAKKHMCAPHGTEHLAALFYYKGPLGCPGDCDYHWYRLDNNGHWSHKPGGTRATDRDGNGDRILDPREAANGPYDYKFVCFMKINRNTIRIEGGH